MTHIEMIIDYITDGADFQYNDNHGVLVRCKDCKLRRKEPYSYCAYFGRGVYDKDYCSHGEKDGDADDET